MKFGAYRLHNGFSAVVPVDDLYEALVRDGWSEVGGSMATFDTRKEGEDWIVAESAQIVKALNEASS